MRDSFGTGTLTIAALLILGLVFAATWINVYVEPDGDPRTLWPWFGGAVAAILVVAFLAYTRRSDPPPR